MDLQFFMFGIALIGMMLFQISGKLCDPAKKEIAELAAVFVAALAVLSMLCQIFLLISR